VSEIKCLIGVVGYYVHKEGIEGVGTPMLKGSSGGEWFHCTRMLLKTNHSRDVSMC